MPRRRDFPGGSEGKESACSVGGPGLIPGLGRSPGEGNGNPVQYSCLENPMDRGAWRATVHGVTKSRTQLTLSLSLTHTYTHTHTEERVGEGLFGSLGLENNELMYMEWINNKSYCIVQETIVGVF